MKQFNKIFTRKDLTSSNWLRKHVKIDPFERTILNSMFRVKDTSNSEDEFEVRLTQICLIYEKFLVDTLLVEAQNTKKPKEVVPVLYEMQKKEEPFHYIVEFARRHIPDFDDVVKQAREEFRDGGYYDYDIHKDGVYDIPLTRRMMGYSYHCNPLVPREWHEDSAQRYPHIQPLVALNQARRPPPTVIPPTSKERDTIEVTPPQRPPKFSLPLGNSDGLLTDSQFTTWCQQNLPEYPPRGGLLQFNGLYCMKDNQDGIDRYFRFYRDGTVASVSVQKPSTAEQVARWIGGHDSQKGKYKMRGVQIAFTTQGHGAVVDYVGIVVNDYSIYLELYSHATKFQGMNWYHYEQVAIKRLPDYTF